MNCISSKQELIMEQVILFNEKNDLDEAFEFAEYVMDEIFFESVGSVKSAILKIVSAIKNIGSKIESFVENNLPKVIDHVKKLIDSGIEKSENVLNSQPPAVEKILFNTLRLTLNQVKQYGHDLLHIKELSGWDKAKYLILIPTGMLPGPNIVGIGIVAVLDKLVSYQKGFKSADIVNTMDILDDAANKLDDINPTAAEKGRELLGKLTKILNIGQKYMTKLATDAMSLGK